MNTQRHIAKRSLPVSGWCAFALAADAMVVVSKHEPHPLRDKDRMHPGKGGA